MDCEEVYWESSLPQRCPYCLLSQAGDSAKESKPSQTAYETVVFTGTLTRTETCVVMRCVDTSIRNVGGKILQRKEHTMSLYDEYQAARGQQKRDLAQQLIDNPPADATYDVLDPSDPTRFYHLENGTARSTRCGECDSNNPAQCRGSDYMFFDPTTGHCDWPSNVGPAQNPAASNAL